MSTISLREVAPHFDRWTGYDPMQSPRGWRDGWERRLAHNLSCLTGRNLEAAQYVLRCICNEMMPGAFCRETGVAQTQDAIGRILGVVCETALNRKAGA